ncbi:GyrI-like domain-containing protein [Thioclava sp. GXIMD4216]|uniref:GyrI-like domain-containing protein n=1 Tax=Thioclava litoralis TaxID=3076557 RepID=A0ABZ1DWG4_9RHOB|nr:GyrI-like domain-containing protein [Thioclava sp. FTW29]
MTIQTSEAFEVIGLSEIVQNTDPVKIGALWARFQSQDVRGALGEAASAELYSVYHDYSGGFLDPYRVTLGYRVPQGTAIPEGFHSAQVPAQKYEVLPTQGPQPQSLIAQWQSIWQKDIPRAFQADFDLYDTQDPTKITVYLGLSA